MPQDTPSPEAVEEFFSKSDFDFSTSAGWDEFLEERRLGGTGRLSDGWHDRDLTNYTVQILPYYLTDTLRAEFIVGPFAAQLQTPVGSLHVYAPDASWEKQAHSFFIGTGFGQQRYTVDVGGPTPNGEEYWGQVYFVAIQTQFRVPGAGSVNRAARMMTAVSRGMSVMGNGYRISARMGNGPYQTDNIMPQQLFDPNPPSPQADEESGFFDDFVEEWNRGWGRIMDGKSPF